MASFPERWLVLESGRSDAAFNMALDAALLELAAETGAPVLRFYGWTEGAASFGYFQKASEIEQITHCRPLVRRPTGGGLVPHHSDWTYSLTIPAQHTWYALRASESYERIHRWIQSSFALLNVPVELAPYGRMELPGQCFAGHEKHDVLWLGRKIAGAAQRRTKTGLLIQGSIQPQPGGVARAAWEKAMLSAGAQLEIAQWEPFVVPPNVLNRAGQLASEKYNQPAYNHRR
jgi:lipoate-protein ligase A